MARLWKHIIAIYQEMYPEGGRIPDIASKLNVADYTVSPGTIYNYIKQKKPGGQFLHKDSGAVYGALFAEGKIIALETAIEHVINKERNDADMVAVMEQLLMELKIELKNSKPKYKEFVIKNIISPALPVKKPRTIFKTPNEKKRRIVE